MAKSIESLRVSLTPSKYLNTEGRYWRAKLYNNELELADRKLEVLHDPENESDPFALEVFCNQTSIGYVQKYTSEVDINSFCFDDIKSKRKLLLEWNSNEFILHRHL